MKFFPRTNNLFDDVFDEMFTSPLFPSHNDYVMKTDILDKGDYYLLDMELPGCKKEDIQIELHDGYLNISASHQASNEEKDDYGNLIRQERYSGNFSRRFYVGENIQDNQIKASYDNGELKITIPKETVTLPEKKTILID